MQIKKSGSLLSVFISFTIVLSGVCSQLAYAGENLLNLHYTTSAELVAYPNTTAINSAQTYIWLANPPENIFTPQIMLQI